MDITDSKPKRWTLYVAPSLIAEYRQLATAHKRSLNSELVWALEQYAKAEKRKGMRDANAHSV